MLIKFTDRSLSVSDVDHPEWSRCEAVRVTGYWSGEEAPEGRHFEARALWTPSHLLVRFVANHREPLIANLDPDFSRKTMGLWDRDVCEIFIAPDPSDPVRYFEFEVAPTGEWIDLEVRQLPGKRETEWNYESGMQAFGKIEEDLIVSAIQVPWASLEISPRSGGSFKGNLLRCVGEGEGRGYLAWRPTLTDEPNFHVPEAFGDFTLVQ